MARNTTDQLIAFCSTIAGKYPFYFQRYSIYLGNKVNAVKPFHQLPQFNYELPSSQSATLDWSVGKWTGVDGVLTSKVRNQDLYRYLQDLTSSKIPGWGAAFTDVKYTSPERDQLLTGMVDLIRSGPNSYAINNAPVPGPDGEADVRYEYAAARYTTGSAPGESQIVPLVPPAGTPGDGTKGFGRFPSITEAGFLFYYSQQPNNSANPPAPAQMRALMVLQPYSPTGGGWPWSANVRYVVKGLENLTIAGQKPFPAPAVGLINYTSARNGYSGLTGSAGHVAAFCNFFTSFTWNNIAASTSDAAKTIPGDNQQSGNPESQYNLISNNIPITTGAQTFDFSGGDITVEIHTGFDDPLAKVDATSLVQTLNFHFPPGKWNWPLDTGTYRNFGARIQSGGFWPWNFIDPTTPNSKDLVRTVQVDPNGPSKGDLRLIAALKTVPAVYFAPYSMAAWNDPSTKPLHSFRVGLAGTSQLQPNSIDAEVVGGAAPAKDIYPVAAHGMTSAAMNSALPGDFDNGPYDEPDGAYINKPDDWSLNQTYSGSSGDWKSSSLQPPNRQVYGPSMFGSLPAKVDPTNPLKVEPWRTLLFCPNPAAGRGHPGFASPRDHLFLDFFTMPVVEPYAISEPFSTAGRVNINFELAPFTYIRRDTAFRGVLKSTRITAFPTSRTHKISPNTNNAAGGTVFRKEIDADQTTGLFYDRFAQPSPRTFTGDTGAFRTASEICDMPLVPVGVNPNAVKNGSYWAGNAFTGDNAREIPYGQIYSRITTKSNVFTVHIRAQTLRKSKPSAGLTPDQRAQAYTQWDDSKDQILGEYRGSSTIERYIDPSDPSLPDFATDSSKTMDDYYRIRVVGTKRFNP
jgi:uncharacterized protein (TIGR02600 family)